MMRINALFNTKIDLILFSEKNESSLERKKLQVAIYKILNYKL